MKPSLAATPSQMVAARAQKGQGARPPSLDDPKSLQATIALPLQTTGPLEQWLPDSMAKASQVCNLPLRMAASDGGLDVHNWRSIVDYEGCWTGRVLVQLQSTAELLVLRQSLHGRGVRVQHHVAGIEVDSTHIELHAVGNVPGGRSQSS